MGAWDFMSARSRRAALVEGQKIGATFEILAKSYGVSVAELRKLADRHGIALAGPWATTDAPGAAEVTAMFRDGMSTADIAQATRQPESAIQRLLDEGRNAAPTANNSSGESHERQTSTDQVDSKPAPQDPGESQPAETVATNTQGRSGTAREAPSTSEGREPADTAGLVVGTQSAAPPVSADGPSTPAPDGVSEPMEESHEIAPALAPAAVSVLPIPPEPETAAGEPIAISLSEEAQDVLSAFALGLDATPAEVSQELLTAILLDDAEAHGRPRTGPALLILTVDVATRDALIAAADRRRREVADLAGEILSVAVNDHMVDAILDDGEAA